MAQDGHSVAECLAAGSELADEAAFAARPVGELAASDACSDGLDYLDIGGFPGGRRYQSLAYGRWISGVGVPFHLKGVLDDPLAVEFEDDVAAVELRHDGAVCGDFAELCEYGFAE